MTQQELGVAGSTPSAGDVANTPGHERGGLSDLARGMALPFAGVGLLLRGRGLLGLALLPAVVTLVATLASLAAVLSFGESLASILWERPLACVECEWGAWLWTRLAVGAWHVYRFLTAILLVTATALLFARVISAPFMDLLARRALDTEGVKPPPGVVAEGDQPFVRSLLLSQRNALGRALIYLLGLGVLFLVTWIPGGALVATPLGGVWTAIWLFADTAVYPLQWVGTTRTADVLSLARARPLLTVGFATCLTLLMMIPLAGLLTTPMAVAGACLLVARTR